MPRCRLSSPRQWSTDEDLDMVCVSVPSYHFPLVAMQRLELCLMGMLKPAAICTRFVSYQGVKQQTWFHTGDNHLAITGDGKRLLFPYPLTRLLRSVTNPSDTSHFPCDPPFDSPMPGCQERGSAECRGQCSNLAMQWFRSSTGKSRFAARTPFPGSMDNR